MKQYQMPVLTDDVLNMTSAAPCEDGWEGNPDDGSNQTEEDTCWREETTC